MNCGDGPCQEKSKRLTKRERLRFKTRKGFSKCPEPQPISFSLFPLFLTLWLKTREVVVIPSATAIGNISAKNLPVDRLFEKCQYIALIKDTFVTSGI